MIQGISGDLNQRQHIVEDLQTLAKPLIDSCDANVALQIQEAVHEAETAWNGTCDNLRDLCTKYQHACSLWKEYREASDAVKYWADEQMNTLGTLKPLDAVAHVKVSNHIIQSICCCSLFNEAKFVLSKSAVIIDIFIFPILKVSK